MILGLGTDIVEIDRIAAVLERHGEHFSERVFTAAEIAQAHGRISYFAGRWAAKEATAKALGCGNGDMCAFTDIEIIDDAAGTPRLNCTAPMLKALADRVLNWHVSISHERSCAVATVILECAGAAICSR